MRSEPSTNVLLARWQGGEVEARDSLIARLHPELAQIAAARLRGERNSSLSTSDLVNDAVLRLIQADRCSLADRAHFDPATSRYATASPPFPGVLEPSTYAFVRYDGSCANQSDRVGCCHKCV